MAEVAALATPSVRSRTWILPPTHHIPRPPPHLHVWACRGMPSRVHADPHTTRGLAVAVQIRRQIGNKGRIAEQGALTWVLHSQAAKWKDR